MPNDFRLPPVGYGPGSQPPGDAGEELSYMAMPKDMATYAPHFPELEDTQSVGPALILLRQIAGACANTAETPAPQVFDLVDLDPANRALIADTLGEGEVSARVSGIPPVAVQETRFAGVWVQSGKGLDQVAVGPVPTCLRSRAFTAMRPAKGAEAPRAPAVINAPPIYAELADKSAAYRLGTLAHVVNFTLLPHTEEDLAWLDAALGAGSVTILSRGYGNCRVSATALDHVWRVQFFNSMDTLILDTFEVTDMPEVVLAAPEDLADSGQRLMRVLEAIT